MLEILLSLIIGTGLGRIGDVLAKERSRKKRLNALVGKAAKGKRKKTERPSQIEDQKQVVAAKKIPEQAENVEDANMGETDMNDIDVGDIKKKAIKYFERCQMSVFPSRVAREINEDEESTRAALAELVAEGKLSCESGFYRGVIMETVH